MMTTQTYMGKWWIPNKKEDTISGVLTILEDGEASLETVGVFEKDNIAKLLDNSKVIPAIWGILSNNKEVSMLSCGVGFNWNMACAFAAGKYAARVVVIGKHIHSWDELGEYDVIGRFNELSLWLRPHNIKQTYYPGTQEVLTTLSDSNPVVVEINDSTKLQLEGEVNMSTDKNWQSINISQGTALKFVHDNPISLQDANQELFAFEQFLSFATLSRVQYTQFQLIDKCKISEENPNPTIDVYEKREPMVAYDKFWKYLFTYDIIKEEFPRIIQKWYSEKEINLIRNHLVESVCNKSYYMSNLFLLVIQALDGFYCRFRKDKVNFTVWMNALVKEFAGISKVETLTELDIKKIHDTRDFYSHLLPQGKKKHVVDDRELSILTFKLRKLLLCCILNVVGFNNTEIDNIFKKSNSQYLNMIGG